MCEGKENVLSENFFDILLNKQIALIGDKE